MNLSRSISTLVAGSLLVLSAAVTPAGAELSNTPQGEWGVSGLATGTQSDGIEAPVLAMEDIGTTMYVGGRFLDVTNGDTTTAQRSLAAFDSDTGDWIPSFTPTFDGAVSALQASPDGTRLFVGGDFTTVNGVTTGGLVALDPTTGAIDATWTGHIGGYNLVRDFEVSGTWLYVAGGFTSVSSSTGGNSAHRVARFDLMTGAHDSSWFPYVAGGSVWAVAASPGLDRIYLAGNFDTSNGTATPGGFVAVEASSGNNVTGLATFPTNTQNASAQFNFDVVVVNDLVFVAGSQHYLQVLNEADLSLEVFHRSSARGDYQSLAVVGDRVYAGCHCFGGTILESSTEVLWVGPRPVGVDDGTVFYSATNSWLSAFSATTGLHIPGSSPEIASTGAGIWAIEASEDACLWAGGAVTETGITAQFGFSRLCDSASIDTERPSTPTALHGSYVAPGTIGLTWNGSTDNFAVAGYRVFNAVTDEAILDVTTESADVSGLAAGTYSFSVRAFDAAGNVSWRTNIVTLEAADVTRPTPPKALVPSIDGPGEVSFTWIDSTDDIGVAGYYVYDATNNTIIADVMTNSVSLTGLAFGTHQFFVRGYDAAGNISWRSNDPSVVLIDLAIDTERPSTPTSLMATVGASGEIDLTWNGSTDNVGVAGYLINDHTTGLPVAVESGTSIQLIALIPGTYTFHVKAFDLAGNTSWRTNTVTVTIP